MGKRKARPGAWRAESVMEQSAKPDGRSNSNSVQLNPSAKSASPSWLGNLCASPPTWAPIPPPVLPVREQEQHDKPAKGTLVVVAMRNSTCGSVFFARASSRISFISNARKLPHCSLLRPLRCFVEYMGPRSFTCYRNFTAAGQWGSVAV